MRFVVGDVLSRARLELLPGPFDTVIDCAVFHSVNDEDRSAYIDGVHQLLSPGGRFVMLVFSDQEPGSWGPRRISREEISAALATGWQSEAIEPALTDLVGFQPSQVRSWLTRRVGFR